MSNPRIAVFVVPAALAASLLVTPGVAATPDREQGATTALQAAEVQQRGDSTGKGRQRKIHSYPKHFAESTPFITSQPRVVGRNLVVAADMKAWRTTSNHKASKWDKFTATISIAKKNQQVRKISLAPSAQKKLAFKKSLKPRKITSSQVHTIEIRLPSGVAKSLRNLSRKQQMRRIAVVVKHFKDVTVAPGHETVMLATSNVRPSIRPPVPTRALRDLRGRSRALGELTERTSAWDYNPQIYYSTVNMTPFNLTGSQAGTNCMNGLSTTPWELPYGGSVYQTVVPMSEQGTANNQSLWQSLTAGVVSSTESAAQAVSNDFIAAAATASTAGAVTAAGQFTSKFLTGLIDNIKSNSCSSGSQSQTWTMSWAVDSVATTSQLASGGYAAADWDVYATQPQSLNNGGYVSAVTNTIPPNQQLSAPELANYPGAQASVQWNWNNGFINMGGPGASYFSGGLTAITATGPLSVYAPLPVKTSQVVVGEMVTGLTFDNTTNAYYGPSFSGDPTASVGSVPNYPVNCALPAAAELIVPFPNATTQSFSNPAAGVSLTGHTTTTFVENDGSGWGTFSGTPTQVSGGFTPNATQFGNLYGTYNPSYQYGCVLGATAEVPDFPAANGGLGMNLGWNMYPEAFAVAP